MTIHHVKQSVSKECNIDPLFEVNCCNLHIIRLNKKKHMIISIHAEKHLINSKYIHDENYKLRLKENFLSLIIGIYNKHHT